MSLSVESVILRDAGPLYSRVYSVIRDQIESGALRPGDRLPSERSICQKLEVSRVTVRRALQELRDDAVIEPAAGRGFRVAAGHVGEPPNALMSFTTMGIDRGLVVTSQVLAMTIRPATIDEAESLRLAPGAPIFELIRVRCFDGLPVALDESRIPHGRVPGIEDVDFSAASLYATLEEQWQIVPTRADYVVEAVGAAEREAQLLELDTNAPLLRARETMYDQRGRPTDSGQITYRGDRYRFNSTLTRRPSAMNLSKPTGPREPTPDPSGLEN